MAIRIVQLGSPRAHGEGLRIGTVRRPPRGVPKTEFASRNFYDVWLPVLSPSEALVKQALVKQALAATDERQWRAFTRHFHAEMKDRAAAHTLDLLAALSHQTHFSVGCYCEHEERCHRSVLRELLGARGAEIR